MTNNELRELLVSKVQQLPGNRLPDLAEWLRALECGEGTDGHRAKHGRLGLRRFPKRAEVRLTRNWPFRKAAASRRTPKIGEGLRQSMPRRYRARQGFAPHPEPPFRVLAECDRFGLC